MTGQITEEAMARTHSPAELRRLASFPLMNPDPVLETDLQGKVCFINPAAQKLFPGLRSAGLRHPFLSDFSSILSAVRAEKKGTCTREVKIGKKWYEQVIYLTSGKSVLRIFGRDVTLRKHAEEYLRRARKGLEDRVLERTRDLTAANKKLAAEIAQREEREQHTSATNDLLKLFSHTFLRRGYLEKLIKLLGKWCSCTSVGIRQIEEEGIITYGAHEGFNPEFMEQKDCLSLKKNQCTCPRVLEGKPDASELPFMTPGGSFYCNDTSCLPSKKAKGMKKLSRGICVLHKYASLAVIPVRYRDRNLGTIHLADKRKGQVPHSLVIFIESMAPLIGEALYRFSVEEALMTSRQQLRELSSHLLAAREEERIKVAGEIHDELGQNLTAAIIELAGIRGKYKGQGQLVEKILSVSGLLNGAVQDIQRICAGLRPRLLDHLGLRAAMEWEAAQFSKRSGIKYSLKMPQNQKKFPPAVATSLFRIFQEALTNVSRHAGATEVSIHLAVEDGSVALEIKDNGKGISREKLAGKKSFGLMGIHERAYDLGGIVTIKGTRDSGTTITVEMPLPGARRKDA